MKKKSLCLVCLLLAACMLGSCVHIEMPEPEPQTVYASFYPIYALAEGVCRDVPNLSLYCLTQPQDGCIRSYSLSNWDAALLDGADLLILGGRGLESFESAFSSGEMAVLTAMENMVLIGADEESTDESSHFVGPNPWLFLSVSGARNIAAVLAAGMAELDPDYAHIYARNLEWMQQELDALSAEILQQTQDINWPGAILLQEGLCYFVQEMGMDAYIEIEREAGTDLSDNEFAEALAQMEQSGFSLVLLERQAPQGLVEAIEAQGYTVCLIDILTDHVPADGFDGYLAAMRNNVAALLSAVENVMR